MAADVSQLLAFSAELEAAGSSVGARAYSLVDHWAHIAEAAIAAKAPGTHYPSTIHADPPVVTPEGIVAVISTPRPDGWRREFGFHGTDSLGRHFSEPGHPHFVPGIDATEVPFLEAVEALGTRVLAANG